MKPLATAFALAALVGCTSTPAPRAPAPEVRREFRALWIATVGNIDWPTRKGLSEKQQKAELLDILDRAQRIGFNTIVFQVRPAADAIYRSQLEPWAAWVTGVHGQGPSYDPLEFAVAESHKRGLQIHAWINPFRAGNSADTSVLASTHVWNARRDLVRVYGSNIWMDPGDPESHERSIRAIRDIATRYDVDGIHADDYFYPYQIRDSSDRVMSFPDDSTYARYGGRRSRDDWRRANIDRFVERMYREVHAVKPNMVVGLSPFGIWRPGYPDSIRGLDAFSTIYADSRKWLQQGWVDYFVPQLYWAIGMPQQSFPTLLDWWVSPTQNPTARHVWPGLAAYRVESGANPFTLAEIPAQMRIVRERLSVPGEVFFNTKSTVYRLDGRIGEAIQGVYNSPATVPSYGWLDSVPPPAPTVQVDGKTLALSSPEPVRWWLVRAHLPAHWTWRGRKPAKWMARPFIASQPVRLETSPDQVLIQAIDGAGNQSAVTEWRRP